MPSPKATFAPRAVARRMSITVELYPSELARLIRVLEADALYAAEHPDQIDYADHLMQRVAALREAGR
jgi:hypothetical protein